MIAGTAEPWLEGRLSLAATGGALLITGDGEDEMLARADWLPGEDAAAVPPGPVLRAGPAAGWADRAAG
jgi:hypothetical protein